MNQAWSIMLINQAAVSRRKTKNLRENVESSFTTPKKYFHLVSAPDSEWHTHGGGNRSVVTPINAATQTQSVVPLAAVVDRVILESAAPISVSRCS